jgi:hypothetical protein
MTSTATTVEQLIAELPSDRRAIVQAVRNIVNQAKPQAVEEGVQYGMIGWYLPHSVYPAGYHCDPKQPLPFASLASQKGHISLHLFCVYCSPEDAEWLQKTALERGCRLDMGKSCVRFKKLEEVPWDVVADVISRMSVERFTHLYDTTVRTTKKKK